MGTCSELLAGVGWTSLAALPFVRQPTLILAGSDDPIIPLVNARIMAVLLPDATLHVYDDGHLGLLTQAHRAGARGHGFPAELTTKGAPMTTTVLMPAELEQPPCR